MYILLFTFAQLSIFISRGFGLIILDHIYYKKKIVDNGNELVNNKLMDVNSQFISSDLTHDLKTYAPFFSKTNYTKKLLKTQSLWRSLGLPWWPIRLSWPARPLGSPFPFFDQLGQWNMYIFTVDHIWISWFSNQFRWICDQLWWFGHQLLW